MQWNIKMLNNNIYIIMSGFISKWEDLSDIFQPRISGTIPATGFISSLGTDLSDNFQPYDNGVKSNATGFKISDGKDLNENFKHKLYTITNNTPNLVFTEYSNNGYTWLVFDVSGNKPNYNTPVSQYPLSSTNITFNRNLNAKLILIGYCGGGAGDGGAGGNGVVIIYWSINQ